MPSPAYKGGAVVQTVRARLPAHVHGISTKVTAPALQEPRPPAFLALGAVGAMKGEATAGAGARS